MPRIREYRWGRWASAALARFEADRPTIVAIDTETTGVGFYDIPFAATLTWRDSAGEIVNFYIGLDTTDTLPVSGAGMVSDVSERATGLEVLTHILEHTPTWAFHNAKFDLQKLMLEGVIDWPTLEGVDLHDTQTLFALLDENGRKGLKHLAATVLGVEDVIEVEIKSGKNKGTFKKVPREQHILNGVRRKLKLTKDDGYHLIPREVIIPYAIKDTEFTLRLFEVLKPRLERIGDERLLDIYAERMSLKRALLEMESDGLGVDLEYLNEAASDYGVRVMDGWSEVVRLVGDTEFNPGSPAQILAAFERRGIALENTQAATLNLLDDEFAKTLVQYREDQKVHKTYLVAIQREQRNGITHPNFNDDAARTGRMSSSAASNN